MTTNENSADYFGNQLQFLVDSIEEQRKIIDRNLTHPARWQGYARRELQGRENSGVRRRVSIAYNNVIEKVNEKHLLNVELLLSVHNDLLKNGGEFRKRGVKVGKKDPLRRPHSSIIPRLVEQALARADDGVEPVPLAAARLHLELLIIHPFRDSNGRVARLVSSFVLMRAGYKSSLLAAVEQHFGVQPRAYARAFRVLREGAESDHAQWLVTALNAMFFNSVKAGWFRTRRDKISSLLDASDIPEVQWVQALTDYDLSKDTDNAKVLQNHFGVSYPPLSKTAKDMQRDELSALIYQVERLYSEERVEGIIFDPYREEILKALKDMYSQNKPK